MADKLKRDITTSAILIASAGGMIGSGWLFSPLYAAQIAGPGALIAWVIAAIFMVFIALPLCELGTIYPISGGLSNYPKFTHGPLVGFIFSWVAWLSYLVMTPIEVQAVLQYSSIFFPELTVKNNGMIELTHAGYCCAFLLLLFITIINTFGIRFIAESNKFVSIWKFFIPLLAVASFFYSSSSFQNLHGLNLALPNTWHNIFSALAIGGVAFGFTGFQNGLIIAGEVKNPQRNIPISILGAVAIGFIIYFLLQFAFIVAIPHTMLTHGFEKLSFVGEAGPLVGLGAILGLVWVTKLLLVDAIVSPLGTSIVYTTATSRILYGMAENGFLPKQLLKLNKYKIPYLTLFVNFGFGLLAFFPFPGWQKMVSFLSSVSILSYGVGSICLLSLRKRSPDLKRPFKLPFPNFVSYIAFFVCNLMLYWCGWDIIWKLYVAVWIGAIIFFLSKRKWIYLGSFKSCAWFFAYIHFILLISCLGNFGGIYPLLISPYDYLTIAIMSVFILTWSKECAIEKIEEHEVWSLEG